MRQITTALTTLVFVPQNIAEAANGAPGRIGCKRFGVGTQSAGRLADGEPMQPRSLTHEFTAMLARRKELPRVRFHELRHSHATQLLLAGVHPKIAQERLGHSTVMVTLDLYSHVTETMQEDAAARIDVALRGGLKSRE